MQSLFVQGDGFMPDPLHQPLEPHPLHQPLEQSLLPVRLQPNAHIVEISNLREQLMCARNDADMLRTKADMLQQALSCAKKEHEAFKAEAARNHEICVQRCNEYKQCVVQLQQQPLPIATLQAMLDKAVHEIKQTSPRKRAKSAPASLPPINDVVVLDEHVVFVDAFASNNKARNTLLERFSLYPGLVDDNAWLAYRPCTREEFSAAGPSVNVVRIISPHFITAMAANKLVDITALVENKLVPTGVYVSELASALKNSPDYKELRVHPFVPAMWLDMLKKVGFHVSLHEDMPIDFDNVVERVQQLLRRILVC